MNEITLSRLEEIAQTVKVEHIEFEISLRNSMERAIHIGRLLSEAKELVKHGEWGKWVEDNCNFSERTAQNFMRLHSKYPELSKAQPVADLTYKKALALLAEPVITVLNVPDASWLEKLQWANQEAGDLKALKDEIFSIREREAFDPSLSPAQRMLETAKELVKVEEFQVRAEKYVSTMKDAMQGAMNDVDIFPQLSAELQEKIMDWNGGEND